MSRPFLARIRTGLRPLVIGTYRWTLNKVWGMDIGRGTRISLTAKLDKTNPRGVHIGEYTAVNFRSAILSHDFINNKHVDTWVGDRCQIGAYAVVMPGVRIGDGSIIAVGSVVMRDIPAGCIAAGNPARVIEQGIITGQYGVKLGRVPSAPADGP